MAISEQQVNFQLIDSTEAHDEELSAVKFSNNGELLASCSWEPKIKLWKIVDDRFERIVLMKHHNEGTSDIAFSKDDRQLASASNDTTVKLTDVEMGKCLMTFEGHTDNVFCIDFRGDMIFSGSDDNTAKIWDRRIGQCIKSISHHTDRVTSVSFRRTGNSLLTSSLDKTFALHDPRTLRVLDNFVEVDAISHARFTGKGRHIAVSALDSAIRIWDTVKKKKKLTYEGHYNTQLSIFSSVSPAGSFLASGSEDNSIYIWNSKSSEIDQVIEGHENVVLSVAFHPRNETILVSGSLDKNMRLYKNETTD